VWNRDEVKRGDVLVVLGPPAAGKTTVASLIAARRSPSVHLHADDF
jgi:adenylate kinase family enzyme